MAYKFFCDTNVVIGFLLKERANRKVAFRLFEAVQNNAVIGFISETTITNIAYVLRKLEPAELLKQHLNTLLFYFNVLPNNTEVCQSALQSAFNDIEDAILYHLALHHSMDYFDFRKRTRL